MSNTVFEVVTYTVKDPEAAEAGRRAALQSVARYPGFIRWDCLTSVDDPCRFVDVLEWHSLEEARAAQDLFLQDPAVRPFLDAFGETLVMTHARRAIEDAA